MRRRPKIAARQKEVKLRKNFLPTFIITLLLWIGIAGVIYFVDPYSTGAIIIFSLVAFFALFFIFSIIFMSSRRGLLTAAGFVLFLILRYFGVGNWLNFLLIMGICLIIEIYFSKK